MMEKNLYDEYCEGIEKNITSVVNAVENGVVLTRREEFDFLFKTYVAGRRKESKMTNLSRCDKTLAKFYAKYFMKAIDWFDEPYTFQKVKKYVNSMLLDSYIGEISNGWYHAHYFDRDGVLFIRLMKGRRGLYEFKVECADDLVLASLALVSYIGSELEIEDSEKEFMSDYLFIEMRRLESRIPSRVYVDKRKHNLSDVIKKSVSKKSREAEKVVRFKVG